MKNLVSLGAAAAIGGLLISANLLQAGLTVGDPAPKLQTGEWVQGEPVTQFDTNHVHVVEFWATWCGPCRTSIPHLNELWQKFKDQGVIVIGQDVWDSDAAVIPFVKKMREQMTYGVALDDKSRDAEGFMASHWWKRGVERHGIPTAFIIDREGRIAWIGHPMAMTENILTDILSGQYDIKKAAADYRQQKQDEARWDELNDRLNKAVDQKRWTEAGSTLDDLLNQAEALKFPPGVGDSYVGTRLRILLNQKKYEEAYHLADAFSDAHPTDARRQNDLAWTLITEKGIEQPNLGLAKKLAERANAATGGKEPAILDTLARVLFMNGEKLQAIEAEQKAAAAAQDQEKTRYQSCLADYREGKLPEVKD